VFSACALAFIASFDRCISLIRLEVKNEVASGIKREKNWTNAVGEDSGRAMVWVNFAHYRICL